MKILSLAPLAGPGLDRLRRLGDLDLDPWSAEHPPRIYHPADLLARLGGVEVLIVEADHVSREVIDGAGSLRVVGTCRGDPVNVDVEAATGAGVAVLHAPGRNATAVAELTIGLAISLVRGVVAADADIRAGAWFAGDRLPQHRYEGREISGMTVGLVGCGHVGREAGWRFAALGARVLGHDPHVDASAMREAGIEPASFGAALGADLVSIHAALTSETRGLIDRRAFAGMRPGVYLVNTARFQICDEEALLGALRSGRVAGAAFDHFPGEVLPADHPLTRMPTVILTPHIGGATHETVVAHTTRMAEALEAITAGRVPANLLNPAVLPVDLTTVR